VWAVRLPQLSALSASAVSPASLRSPGQQSAGGGSVLPGVVESLHGRLIH
jgi:hypothetical protein